MKISLIAVGKIKESFYRDAVAEYAKRLSSYCELSLIEVEDEATKENLSPAAEAEILEKEGARILAKLPKGSYPIALCIDGKSRDSLEMAEWIGRLGVQGQSHLCFIIGGSLGLAPSVTAACRERISFSKLTFPHQLMRVILLEQIYRSFRINKNEPYHK